MSARRRSSRCRPFVKAGVIEPWDNYIPKEVIDDIIPSIREECTIDGKLYSWPFLLDVIGSGWHSGITTKAGLAERRAGDLGRLPGRARRRSSIRRPRRGAPPSMSHGWRSLAPITHSMSTKVYTPEGLFDFTSEPAIEALKLMKQIMAYSNPDILLEGASDAGVNGTPDEIAFAAQRVGLYFKYFNAPLRFAASWDDPKLLRLGPLPKFANGEGSTVFWTTGCALFKYGQNKEKAAEYIKALTYDPQIWKDSIVGTPERPSRPAAALQVDLRGVGRQEARLDAAGRRLDSRSARPRQGDQQQPLRPAAVRHRQADLGDLPQGRGTRSEGGDAEGHGRGPSRGEEGLDRPDRGARKAAASQPAARCAVGSAGLGEWRKRL